MIAAPVQLPDFLKSEVFRAADLGLSPYSAAGIRFEITYWLQRQNEIRSCKTTYVDVFLPWRAPEALLVEKYYGIKGLENPPFKQAYFASQVTRFVFEKDSGGYIVIPNGCPFMKVRRM